jgi:Holliday junction resolvasome RuvABC endonuclease subunit
VLLALDLAADKTGWAALGPGPTVLATGTYRTPDRQKGEARPDWLLRRMLKVELEVAGLLSRFGPTILAYEFPDRPRGAFAGGSKGREFHAMQGLANAEGLLVAVLRRWNGRKVAVGASVAKKCVTTNRDAPKEVVRSWLGGTIPGYGLPVEGLGDDEVDAIAVGVTALEFLAEGFTPE